MDSFKQLLNLPVSQVHVWSRDHQLNPVVFHYANILSLYFQGDLERLKEYRTDIARANQFTYQTDLKQLLEWRILLREGEISLKDLEQIKEKPIDELFFAEKYFIIARGFELNQVHREATRYYTLAYNEYKKLGCHGKAIRSYFNSVVSISREYPHKNMLSEYQSVIELNKDVDDKSFSGMVHTMISREYQIIGLLDRAIESADEGLNLLKDEKGAIHFYHALLHKAHLMIQYQNIEEAQKLIKEAGLAPFSEIKAAVKLLNCSLEPTMIWNTTLEKDLMPTWKERVPELLSQNKSAQTDMNLNFSPLESKLIKNLWSGPVEKWDLIQMLYSDSGDSIQLENRLKNLLARFRKKQPNCILCEGSRYFLNKESISDFFQ